MVFFFFLFFFFSLALFAPPSHAQRRLAKPQSIPQPLPQQQPDQPATQTIQPTATQTAQPATQTIQQSTPQPQEQPQTLPLPHQPQQTVQSATQTFQPTATQTIQLTAPQPDELPQVEGKESVFIESADYMKYEKNSKITTLTGDVRIKIRDSKVRADKVTLDEKNNSVVAGGRVVMEDGDNTLAGTALYYDYDKEYFEILKVEGSTTSDQVNGHIYYRGERAIGTRNRIIIYKGQFTTCDPTCPTECHVLAKRIMIIPGSKIVSKNAYFYIGPRKIWYMPYHVISLKDQQQNLPEFGYTKEEGFYVKTRYPYLSRNTIAGVVLLDFFTKKGVNYGAEHNYTSKFFGGKGYNFYKTIKEKDTGLVSTQINQWQDFILHRDITGRINYNRISSYTIYQDRNRSNNSSTQLTLSHDAKRSAAGAGGQSGPFKRQESFSYLVRQQYSYSQSYNSDMSMRQHYYLHGNMDYDYEYKETVNKNGLTNADKEGSYISTFTKRSKNFNLTARTAKTFDLDGDTFLGDNSYGVNTVLPEATLEMTDALINKIISFKNPASRPRITFRATNGRYREGSRSDSHVIRRTALDTGIGRALKLAKRVTLTPQENYSQYFYQTKDARFLLVNTTTLNWRFTPVKTLNLNYNRSQGNGGAPFQKDSIGKNNSLNGVFSITKARTNFTLSTGYNYLVKMYQPLNTGYLRAISHNSTLNVTMGFDLENDIWSPTVTSLKLARKNMDLNIGANWDTKELHLTNSQITTQFRRNNGWKFDVRAVYDHPRYYPFIREWVATKTRCCTEVQFAYNAEREEYRLNFFILALPHQNIGFYKGQQGFNIDESAFQTKFGGTGQYGGTQ